MVNDVGSSLPPVPIKLKNFRKGTPKSRNGCTTCKIRRIKCDETKPACMKCTQTGRKCDGYLDRRTSIKTNQSLCTASPAATYAGSPHNPLLDFPGGELEHRFLMFFYHHTIPVISGCFDSEFWNDLIRRVGYSEPTIQHAMIAIGAVHARLALADKLPTGVDEREGQRFELQQYNKAIHYLRGHLSLNGITLEVTLSCCVLLICLELLRGNVEQAILHLQGGASILRDYRTTKLQGRIKNASHVSSSSDIIARKLEDIFHRLGIQWTLCGRSIPQSEEIELDSRSPMSNQIFLSLEDATASLAKINDLCLRFVHLSIQRLYASPSAGAGCNTKDSLSVTHAWLSTQLQNWLANFESFLAEKSHKPDTRFSNGATLLRIFYLTCTIWLSVCTSPLETAFDDKLPEFSSIIDLASSLKTGSSAYLNLPPNPSASGTFSFAFEMGVIAPLYFTAMKCRHPVLRQKAISLLSSCMPRREGLWDAEILVCVVRRLVDIEEAGLNGLDELNNPMVSETVMPAEDDRVVHVMTRYEQDRQHQGQKCCSVTYMMKPVAGSEEWVFWQEDIVIGSGSSYRQSGETAVTKSAQRAIALATTAFELRDVSVSSE